MVSILSSNYETGMMNTLSFREEPLNEHATGKIT